MAIHLKDVLRIDDLTDYKVHFAKWNKIHQPLDVFISDPPHWQRWQEYRPKVDSFNRRYIFSLAHFYHEVDVWLFTGIYEVVQRHDDRYEVQLLELAAPFIGRLKLRSSYRERAVRVKLEGVYDRFEVSEILAEPFAGRAFTRYEDIHLSFDEIAVLVRNNRSDWGTALENVKGIYLITDQNTGKRYVGSAYGDCGIWSRWCSYVETVHGGNVELRQLLEEEGADYCRANLRYALLEHRDLRTPDEVILKREEFWKQLLRTRGQQGLNRN